MKPGRPLQTGVAMQQRSVVAPCLTRAHTHTRSEDLHRDFITEVTFSEKLQVDGDTVRRKRKKQKTAHRSADEEVPPPAEADEEEEPGAGAGDGGEEQELRQSRPSQVAWTTSRSAQRWGPFR